MRAWSLDVKGIIHADEAEAEKLEKQLAIELHAVLSQAKYGAHHSVLGTPSVYDAVHTPQTVSAEDAAPAPAPAPVESILQPATAPAGPITAVPAGIEFTPELLNAAVAKLQELGLIVPAPAAPEVPAQQQ